MEHSTVRRCRRHWLVLLGAALGSLGSRTASAQSEESDPAPALGAFEAAPLPPPQEPFLLPDVPDSLLEQTQLRERWFTLKMGLVLIADYTAFDQDADSLGQVGTQEDQLEARAARLMFRGTLGEDHKVGYLVAAEYKGFETEPEDLWSLTDLSFTFPLDGPATKLTLGKTKETFAYEMVGDAANLPQLERVQSPFFVSRNIGVKVTRVIGAAQRMTASAGVFNDWFTTGDSLADSGTDVSTRITGLAWDQPDGKSFLHLGVSGRYVGADDDTLRYKGRPESNVTDNYVDTGDLASDHAWHLGLETLWNEGPYSVLAEYDRAWVDAPSSGDPEFWGGYVTGKLDPDGRDAALRSHRRLCAARHARGAPGRARAGRARVARGPRRRRGAGRRVRQVVSRPQLVGHAALEAGSRLGPHRAGPLRHDRRDGQLPGATAVGLLTVRARA